MHLARVRLDGKLLVRGLAVIAALFAAGAIGLAVAGPPPATVMASITVPVEVVTPPPESELPPPEALLPPRDYGRDKGAEPASPPSTAFDKTDKRPRIAIVISELGPSHMAAETAIRKLPPDITLAFLPFANDTGALADEARAAGHEVLLAIPMEPATYPDDDPGPDALMTTVSDAENMRRLGWDLARAGNYAGIVNFMGSRFTVADQKLKPFLATIHQRGLMIVDTRANPLSTMPEIARSMKIPVAVADLAIDASASRDAIDQNLAKLEELAARNGHAVGIAGTYPVTFERLEEWSKALAGKGIVLAPVSAVVTNTAAASAAPAAK